VHIIWGLGTVFNVCWYNHVLMLITLTSTFTAHHISFL